METKAENIHQTVMPYLKKALSFFRKMVTKRPEKNAKVEIDKAKVDRVNSDMLEKTDKKLTAKSVDTVIDTGSVAAPVDEPGDEPRDEPGITDDAGIKNVMDKDTEEKIIAAIRQVYDPEIRVNIYDLGLIYKIVMPDKNTVMIDMTLTAAACPVAEILPVQVSNMVKSIEGIEEVTVNLVWEPPWNQELISEAARLELGLL